MSEVATLVAAGLGGDGGGGGDIDLRVSGWAGGGGGGGGGGGLGGSVGGRYADAMARVAVLFGSATMARAAVVVG